MNYQQIFSKWRNGHEGPNDKLKDAGDSAAENEGDSPRSLAANGSAYEAVKGDDGTWGVRRDDGTELLYEPSFARATAEAIADMENSDDPPMDWEQTKERLTKMGLPS